MCFEMWQPGAHHIRYSLTSVMLPGCGLPWCVSIGAATFFAGDRPLSG
nr:MAG TPA: histocompatibility antigen [Caudoviricetes sp.]